MEVQLSIDPSFEPINQPTQSPFRLEKRYSVLSLDGGGVRGLMTCRVLEEIEQEFRFKTKNKNFKIMDAFDCVIGTSVGGLIALGLASGYSAKKMSKAMQRMIPYIFKDEFNPLDLIKIPGMPIKTSQLFGVGYDEKGLEEQLFKYLFSDNDADFVYGDPKSASKLKGKKNATLKDLKEANPHLRVCLVSCSVSFDE